jgi:tetratricopeptide (TPR) repeat protein
VLVTDEPDVDTAALAAELARLYHFTGDDETASARIEVALDVAERTGDMTLLASSLNTKALTRTDGHPHESYLLIRGSLEIALDHDLVFEALRAYNNLAIALDNLDRVEEILPLVEEAVALAHRRGDRAWTNALSAALVDEYVLAGRWDEAEKLFAELHHEANDVGVVQSTASMAEIARERGREAEAPALLARVHEAVAATDEADYQRRGLAHLARRVQSIVAGDADGVLDAAEDELQVLLQHPEQKLLIANAVRHAAAGAHTADAGRAGRIADGVAGFASSSRIIASQHARLEGVLAARRGDHDEAAERYGVALAAARSIDYVPWIAEILVDYAASLVADERPEDAESLLAEAREIAERLSWVRLLARIETLEQARVPA